MTRILIALTIGVAAGVADVMPMLFQKLSKWACISAFVHWIFLGLIIPFVSWHIQPWLKGLIISLMAATPVIVMVYPQDRKAVVPIAFSSVILGILVGIAGAIYIS